MTDTELAARAAPGAAGGSGTPGAPAAEDVHERRALPWWAVPAAVLAVLLSLPYSTLHLPGVFEHALNSPSTLHLLALCLVFGGLATSYDLLYGRVGLLSFGHALYFACGAYAAALLMSVLELPLVWAALVSVVGGTLLALILGAVSLRVNGIALAMVTLAFAEAGSILISRDPGRWTGGEEGRSLDASAVPDAFVGVANTVNLYWVAIGYIVIVLAVVWWLAASPVGRVWQGIRANEQRVAVLGINPYPYKLVAFTAGGGLASLGGVAYLLINGGVTPGITTAEFTLTLLVMVALGGAGTRWGPFLGAALYTYAEHRLLQSGGTFDALPGWIAAPLSQPLFILGVLFVLMVFFFPGGLVALPGRIRAAVRDRNAERTRKAVPS